MNKLCCDAVLCPYALEATETMKSLNNLLQAAVDSAAGAPSQASETQILQTLQIHIPAVLAQLCHPEFCLGAVEDGLEFCNETTRLLQALRDYMPNDPLTAVLLASLRGAFTAQQRRFSECYFMVSATQQMEHWQFLVEYLNRAKSEQSQLPWYEVAQGTVGKALSHPEPIFGCFDSNKGKEAESAAQKPTLTDLLRADAFASRDSQRAKPGEVEGAEQEKAVIRLLEWAAAHQKKSREIGVLQKAMRPVLRSYGKFFITGAVPVSPVLMWLGRAAMGQGEDLLAALKRLEEAVDPLFPVKLCQYVQLSFQPHAVNRIAESFVEGSSLRAWWSRARALNQDLPI